MSGSRKLRPYLWLLLLATCAFAQNEPAEDRLAERDAFARHQVRTAVEQAGRGNTELLWTLLRHSADPSARSYLIRDLGSSGIPSDLIIQRLAIESDTSVRRALVLSLGGFTSDQIPPAKRKALVARLLILYRQDPDAGVHSAVDWLLRYSRQGLLDLSLIHI